MKINTRQLRRILKEEKTRLLKENQLRHPKTGENMLLMINDLVDTLMNQGMDYGELAEELRGLADAVEGSQPGDQGSEWTEEDEEKYAAGRPWEHN